MEMVPQFRYLVSCNAMHTILLSVGLTTSRKTSFHTSEGHCRSHFLLAIPRLIALLPLDTPNTWTSETRLEF